MNKKIIGIVLVLVVIGVGFLIYKNQTSDSLGQEIKNLLAQKYNRPANTIMIKVGTDTGTFAKGTVNFADEKGGGMWFAAKTANGWELAFDGNGIILCGIANKYNFSKDIIPQCLDELNGNKLIER